MAAIFTVFGKTGLGIEPLNLPVWGLTLPQDHWKFEGWQKLN